MKVAPLPPFELSSSLDRLNLQANENLQNYHQSQTPVRSPTPDDDKVQLPKIVATFSLAPHAFVEIPTNNPQDEVRCLTFFWLFLMPT